MTPLQLLLLIRCADYRRQPNSLLPEDEAVSEGMAKAVGEFIAKGVFRSDVTLDMLVCGRRPKMGFYGNPYLTDKGCDLLDKIAGSAIEFYKEM